MLIWLIAAQYSFFTRSSPEQKVRFLGMVHYWSIVDRKCYILIRDSKRFKCNFI